MSRLSVSVTGYPAERQFTDQASTNLGCHAKLRWSSVERVGTGSRLPIEKQHLARRKHLAMRRGDLAPMHLSHSRQDWPMFLELAEAQAVTGLRWASAVLMQKRVLG